MLISGALSAGHGRTLVTADDPAGLAGRIITEGLSVRQAEELAQMPAARRREALPSSPIEKDIDTLALVKLLSDTIGMKVTISQKAKGGELRVAYRSLEQLDDLCRRLKRE